ncbi:hypothetical protein [Runella salmonicolor]|uniref:Uncharacterized protein n=1 Tax=Runella salmonicolor TaxID=2950278 RepID=A0ABT1FST3_9BACT|nr:hypothetical protein [Runella salmonicolor]MCP1384822.1 hypothetical protein [Runella salmonicolor]
MLVHDNVFDELPVELKDIVDNYNAQEIIEFFEDFELYIETMGFKQDLNREFWLKQHHIFFLFKRAVRVLGELEAIGC